MKQQNAKRWCGAVFAGRAVGLLATTVQLAACTIVGGSTEVAAPPPAVVQAPASAETGLIWAIPVSKPTHIPATSGDTAAGGSWLPAKQRIMGSLLWPVQGHVRRGFGTQPSGARSDGLDITAGEGALVVAADDGVVTYAGSELQGYGNMLLIAHPDGYTTIYAHNQSLLVGVGAEVRRGQPIATVGRTGDVDDPQLHFQVRAGNRPVDPTAYLESKPTIVASLAATPMLRSGE
jgi:murein DD-endopeptidase MepM/ murein hydrolase activator NlpD